MWTWKRRRSEGDTADHVLSPDEFEIELEKRSSNLLGMDLDEFRKRASVGELPDTPAVDHLRFLLGV